VVGFLVLHISARPSLSGCLLAFCNAGSWDPCNPGIPGTGPDPGNSVYPVQDPEQELGGGISARSGAREPDLGNVLGQHLYAKMVEV
jgi:hypothetical protein